MFQHRHSMLPPFFNPACMPECGLHFTRHVNEQEYGSFLVCVSAFWWQLLHAMEDGHFGSVHSHVLQSLWQSYKPAFHSFSDSSSSPDRVSCSPEAMLWSAAAAVCNMQHMTSSHWEKHGGRECWTDIHGRRCASTAGRRARRGRVTRRLESSQSER